MLKEVILVFLGGGIGSVLRYCTQVAFRNTVLGAGAFPWSTFTVNLAGSFLIGLLYSISARFNLSDDVRLLLTTGLCGGFTTFSTFSNESLSLLKQGNTMAFVIYVSLSLFLGIWLVFMGAWCGESLSHLHKG